MLPGRAKHGQEVKMDGVLDGKVLGKVVAGKGDVKKGIEAKRKEESARGVNWATLYMNVSRYLVGSLRSMSDDYRVTPLQHRWRHGWGSQNQSY